MEHNVIFIEYKIITKEINNFTFCELLKKHNILVVPLISERTKVFKKMQFRYWFIKDGLEIIDTVNKETIKKSNIQKIKQEKIAKYLNENKIKYHKYYSFEDKWKKTSHHNQVMKLKILTHNLKTISYKELLHFLKINKIPFFQNYAQKAIEITEKKYNLKKELKEFLSLINGNIENFAFIGVSKINKDFFNWSSYSYLLSEKKYQLFQSTKFFSSSPEENGVYEALEDYFYRRKISISI